MRLAHKIIVLRHTISRQACHEEGENPEVGGGALSKINARMGGLKVKLVTLEVGEAYTM